MIQVNPTALMPTNIVLVTTPALTEKMILAKSSPIMLSRGLIMLV